MPDLPPDRDRLHRALAALLGRDATAVLPRKLGGGTSNESYVVEHAGAPYVLRLKRESAGATLGLVEELELLRVVAAAGITAEPVGVDVATGALLTRFVPHAVKWTAEAARGDANIARIAALLRRLHGVAAQLREFEPAHYAELYVNAAAALAPLGARDRQLAQELRGLAEEHRAQYRASVVCHNDLTAGNILDAGELLLVDFEYAARASPVVDLASLAAMNDYDRRQCRELLRAYFMTVAAPISAAEFAKVVRMVRLIAYFWALASTHE
jgi:thiamine kinase-like enzyme